LGQITLESFLKNVTGLLGVIPADQYLEIMGWTLVTDTEGQVHLVKARSVTEKPSLPLTSNLSVRDIINHVYQIGLLARPERSARYNNTVSTMTMSFAAAPNAANTSQTKTQSNPKGGHDASKREFDDLVRALESINVPR
jgi:hypothetical protein